MIEMLQSLMMPYALAMRLFLFITPRNNLPKPLKALFYVLRDAFGIKMQGNKGTS